MLESAVGGWGPVVILLLVGLGGYYLVKVRGERRLLVAPWEDAAVETLRQRYARGEIGREEFEQLRREVMRGG